MNDKKKATAIGIVCICAYMANYYLRHILSVLTPTLLLEGSYTVNYIATLSSVYMLFYAAGQLVNGFLGDIISPKNMVSIGLLVSGGAITIFPFIANKVIQIVIFSVFGFGLSMLRGPLMKIISENTKSNYARLVCVFFSFSSFAGPLIASAFALINGWKITFVAAGIIATALGILAFFAFTVMETKGLISYIRTEVKGISSIFEVFKIKNILFYIIVACIVEISAASISQWMTTFLTIRLSFSKDTANMIYSGISICRSFMPFVALVIFRVINEKDIPMLRVTFSVSGTAFALLIVSPNNAISIILLAIALMAMSCASALLWSIYIPGLGKTGKVSSVNGVMDCIGYIAAAGANLLFANLMSNASWNTVYIVWATIGIIGFLATYMCQR